MQPALQPTLQPARITLFQLIPLLKNPPKKINHSSNLFSWWYFSAVPPLRSRYEAATKLFTALLRRLRTKLRKATKSGGNLSTATSRTAWANGKAGRINFEKLLVVVDLARFFTHALTDFRGLRGEKGGREILRSFRISLSAYFSWPQCAASSTEAELLMYWVC